MEPTHFSRPGEKTGSKNGTNFGTHFWNQFWAKNGTRIEQKVEPSAQVKLFLVWVAYLNATGYSMREAVWINIDESALPYHFSGLKGLRKLPANKKESDEMRCKASLCKTRSKCTLIASIASDLSLQKYLPQVFLPKEKGMVGKWKAAESLIAPMPSIDIIRGTSGWMNSTIMKDYLKILGPVVKAHAGDKKIVLVWDCCSSHISVHILRIVRKMKWRILMIPAGLTYLLQPLDAYVFGQFKRRLQESHVANRLQTKDGDQSFESWMQTNVDTIANTFSHMDTKPYFERCGCTIPSSCLSKIVQRYVDEADLGKHRKLTKHELSQYLGMTANAHHSFLFPTSVPESMASMNISLHVPTHRLTSKKSLIIAE